MKIDGVITDAIRLCAEDFSEQFGYESTSDDIAHRFSKLEGGKIMHIARKDKVKKPIINSSGEHVYEMIGNPSELGGAIQHSFAHVVIPLGCSSQLHYHPQAEETYYILKGSGKMVVDDKEFLVKPEDAVFIAPPEEHQIFANGDEDLEFIAICAPAWEPNNSVFLD